jgi:hypothetical protein
MSGDSSGKSFNLSKMTFLKKKIEMEQSGCQQSLVGHSTHRLAEVDLLL